MVPEKVRHFDVRLVRDIYATVSARNFTSKENNIRVHASPESCIDPELAITLGRNQAA